MNIEQIVGKQRVNNYINNTLNSIKADSDSTSGSFESALSSKFDDVSESIFIDLKDITKPDSGAFALDSPREKDDKTIGSSVAKKLVQFLDKTRFLDKVVDGLISSSGLAGRFSGSMKIDAKLEFGNELIEVLSDMTWSEAMEFISKLKLKVDQGDLKPSIFRNGKMSSEEVVEEVMNTAKRHIESIEKDMSKSSGYQTRKERKEAETLIKANL